MTAGDRKPYFEVKQVGRWRYQVIKHLHVSGFGMAGFEGPTVLGRARAERRAARDLRRYLRDEGWAQTPVAVIRPGDLDGKP